VGPGALQEEGLFLEEGLFPEPLEVEVAGAGQALHLEEEPGLLPLREKPRHHEGPLRGRGLPGVQGQEGVAAGGEEG